MATRGVEAKKVPPPEASDPRWYVPGLKTAKQETKTWCWAAVTQAILSIKTQAPHSQCEISSKYHNEDCCQKHHSVQCEGRGEVTAALQAYGVNAIRKSPNFDEVIAAVKNGNVVAIPHKLDIAGTGNAHVVLAYGAYKKGDGEHYLIVWDPLVDGIHFWSRDYVVGNLAWYNVIYPQ